MKLASWRVATEPLLHPSSLLVKRYLVLQVLKMRISYSATIAATAISIIFSFVGRCHQNNNSSIVVLGLKCMDSVSGASAWLVTHHFTLLNTKVICNIMMSKANYVSLIVLIINLYFTWLKPVLANEMESNLISAIIHESLFLSTARCGKIIIVRLICFRESLQN
jgi:hypothetical protein